MNGPTLTILAAALAVACAAGPDGAGLLPKSYDGALVVAPSPAALPGTRVGCVGSLELELVNTSADLPVRVTNATLPDPALSLGQALPLVIDPGARRAVDLHFTPDAPGVRAGVAALTTDEGRLYPLELPVRAEAYARTEDDPAAEVAPLDLVLVLDVSTTMNELAALRTALESAWAFVETHGADVRFGLTTFENDVLVHAGGRFLERERFFQELDSQLLDGAWVPDPARPRQLLNFDYAENVLDALARSAEEFAFRPAARRYQLLMTDDTFLEPPFVFSDGTPVRHDFRETSHALTERGILLFSIHAPLRGRGLSSALDGEPSLVSATGGAWFEVSDVDRGALALDALLLDLIAGRTCS